MSDLPSRVIVNEEGPREGVQIEQRDIPTAEKVAFIEALAETGVRKIDTVSFVSPKRVPQMADAAEVANAIRKRPGVQYTGLWLNRRGMDQALETQLDVVGTLRLTASETFSIRNTGRDHEQTVAEQRSWIERFAEIGVPITTGYIMTAFGCNFEGPVATEKVVALVGELVALAEEAGGDLSGGVYLADTVGHAAPTDIERVVFAVREAHPDLPLGTHLHDTRGLGIANAHAALQLGVDRFDTSCAGLGGCPFAGHSGAAGNVCTEEFVFLCERLGIETGIDLEAAIECAWMAERMVGHELPGKLTRGGPLSYPPVGVPSRRG